MRIIFLLTALVGLLLLSITLNAVRKGKIFRRLKKTEIGAVCFFRALKNSFLEVCSIICSNKIKRLHHFFIPELYIMCMENFMSHLSIV